jgi:hypothetical protein
MDLDQALDELYGAAPDEFVATRTRLAKALKDEGRTDDAATVAATRKPPLAAWALNELSRRNRRAVDLLLDAGHRLRDAQAAILRGEDRELFERARSDESKAVAALLRDAEQLLRERGTASAAVVDQIRESLQAAAIGEEGRELLARGRFTAPIRRQGFELVGELVPKGTTTPRKRARLPDQRKQDEEALREAKATLRTAEREARKAWELADRVRSEAEAARRDADKAGAARDAAAARLNAQVLPRDPRRNCRLDERKRLPVMIVADDAYPGHGAWIYHAEELLSSEAPRSRSARSRARGSRSARAGRTASRAPGPGEPRTRFPRSCPVPDGSRAR